jgi:sporulation protein YlmC with PRC-barrel domain
VRVADPSGEEGYEESMEGEGLPESTAQMQHDVILESSKLSDLDVFNGTGDKLGNIDNLIIDAHRNLVLCGIMDTGLGGKLIAVPWNAFRLERKEDTFRLVLNVNKNELDQAPTFDADHRPDFTSAEWQQTAERFFHVKPLGEALTGHERAVGVLSPREMILESGKLSDLNVFNSEGKKLGNIDDLVIDASDGMLLYGILDTGIGGKLITVPWNAVRLQLDRQDNRYSLVLNMTSDQLANGPTYDSDHRPNFTDPRWQDTVNRFFGVRTAARPVAPDEETHQD